MDLPEGQYSGVWLNTKTGSADKSENFRHSGGDKALQSPEFRNGIALRLKRSAP